MKGNNIIYLKIEILGESGFNLILYPKSRIEITGIVKNQKVIQSLSQA